jgi:DUF4097 and DUF4098 domain-containing protein YvlB
MLKDVIKSFRKVAKMKNPNRKIHTILLLLAFLALLAAPPAFCAIEDTIKKSFKVEAGGQLILESDIGSVEVRAGQDNALEVEVIRNVHTSISSKAKRIMEDFKIDFRQEGNTVYITGDYERDGFTRFWDELFGKSIRVKFLVSVPAKFNLDLKTGGGSISVEDIEGQIQSRTSGGSLHFDRVKGPILGKTSGGSIKLLSGVGKAELRTSGGGITIGEVEGDIIAHTSGGSIKIGRAKGEVDASTSGGSIRVEEVTGAIKARTSGGSITASISGQPASDSRLTTSGGSVTLSLAEDIKADVDAHTSGGRVHTDFPVTIQGEVSRSSLRARINGGGPELYLRSSGGSIYIRKRQ